MPIFADAIFFDFYADTIDSAATLPPARYDDATLSLIAITFAP